MSARIWMALYQPYEGKEEDLKNLIAKHYPTLARLELITDRPCIVAKASNGTYIEIAEWRDGDSAEKAHKHPEVSKLWDDMGAVSEFKHLGSLSESEKLFPHFEHVDL